MAGRLRFLARLGPSGKESKPARASAIPQLGEGARTLEFLATVNVVQEYSHKTMWHIPHLFGTEGTVPPTALAARPCPRKWP